MSEHGALVIPVAPVSPLPRQSTPLNGDLIVNAIAMNFNGKFKSQEVKELGHSVIKHIVNEKRISLLFGQQCNFRLTSLPENLEQVGGQKALILFDRRHLKANDENQYRHFLRDLELRGRLPRYYLPETSYTICKMECKYMPDLSFIAMSWVTDETQDNLQSLNLLRNLLSFTANLCAIEEMPILIAGSFRLSLDQIKQVVYNEFEGFRCYGYKTDKSKRQQRMCNTFISCPPLKLEGVKPLVCGKVEVSSASRLPERQRDPEEAFYWDPVFAYLLRRTGTSTVMSPISPRAFSPPTLELPSDSQSKVENWRISSSPGAAEATRLTTYRRSMTNPTFDSAEETLKALLLESERIKQLVNEAENRARSRLSPHPDKEETKSGESHLNIISADYNEKKTIECLFNSLGDDEEFCRLEAALLSGKPVDLILENCGKEESGPVPPRSPLRKIPSYVDLYDEELIDANKQCYMQ